MENVRNIILLVLIAPGYSQIIVKERDNYKNVAKALLFLIEDFYAKQTSLINIVVECEDVMIMHYQLDVLEEVLIHLNFMKVEVEILGGSGSSEKKVFPLLLVDSEKSFKKLFQDDGSPRFEYNTYYLVHLKRAANYFTEMNGILSRSRELNIADVNIVVEPLPNEILIYTYFPYTAHHCTGVVPVVENQFINGSLKYKRRVFPDKTGNLYQCPVKVATWIDPPFVLFDKDKTGPDYYTGIEGKILKYLSIKMNFSVVTIFTGEEQRRGFDNSTRIRDIITVDAADITIGRHRCRESKFLSTDAYYMMLVVFVGRFGDNYTSLERLIFPFSIQSWICIFLAACIGVFIITIFKRTRKSFQRFVLGNRNPTPFLSMFSGVLGGPVEPLPTRNFARFLLTMWLLLTIVLRISYQALLYDFIRTDRVKNAPETIKDIINEKYKVLVTPSIEETLQYLPEIKRLSIVLDYPEIYYFKELEQIEDKVVILTPLEYFLYYMKTEKRYGKLSVVKERVFAQQLCIYFGTNTILRNAINYHALRFTGNGMTEKFALQFLDRHVNNDDKTLIPRELTFDHVSGCFQIYFVLIIFCVFVFLCEVISLRCALLTKLLEIIQ